MHVLAKFADVSRSSVSQSESSEISNQSEFEKISVVTEKEYVVLTNDEVESYSVQTTQQNESQIFVTCQGDLPLPFLTCQECKHFSHEFCLDNGLCKHCSNKLTILENSTGRKNERIINEIGSEGKTMQNLIVQT